MELIALIPNGTRLTPLDGNLDPAFITSLALIGLSTMLEEYWLEIVSFNLFFLINLTIIIIY